MIEMLIKMYMQVLQVIYKKNQNLLVAIEIELTELYLICSELVHMHMLLMLKDVLKEHGIKDILYLVYNTFKEMIQNVQPVGLGQI